MNRKGFTLVELIAMMVVIAVLMVIAVPNISGIVKNNRESIGVEDINKMIGNAKTKIETGKVKAPGLNECIVISLNYLDSNNDFKTGINGGEYEKNESVIIVKKVKVTGTTATNRYKYYFRTIEVKNGKNYVTKDKNGSIRFVDFDDFKNNPGKYTPIQASSYRELGLNSNTNEGIKNSINTINSGLCSSVVEVYK